MLAALEEMRGEYVDGFAVEVVNVDADETLQARYDELVPVLVGKVTDDIRELCHYFLDAQAVRGYLEEFGATPVVTADRLRP